MINDVDDVDITLVIWVNILEMNGLDIHLLDGLLVFKQFTEIRFGHV